MFVFNVLIEVKYLSLFYTVIDDMRIFLTTGSLNRIKGSGNLKKMFVGVGIIMEGADIFPSTPKKFS